MVLGSAGILQFVFPAPEESVGWQLLELRYATWLRLHFASVAMMGLAVLLHLILHWNWVVGFITARVPARAAAAGHTASIAGDYDVCQADGSA